MPMVRLIGLAMFGAIIGLLILAAFILAASVHAHARPGPQWEGAPANIRSWFSSLMQPDNPVMSCCGEADAFEADTFEVDGDHYVAIITDGKGAIPEGTRIAVPNAKIKWDAGNPTGHGIIFLSGPIGGEPGAPYTAVMVNGSPRYLYCYVAPGGV